MLRPVPGTTGTPKWFCKDNFSFTGPHTRRDACSPRLNERPIQYAQNRSKFQRQDPLALPCSQGEKARGRAIPPLGEPRDNLRQKSLRSLRRADTREEMHGDRQKTGHFLRAVVGAGGLFERRPQALGEGFCPSSRTIKGAKVGFRRP